MTRPGLVARVLIDSPLPQLDHLFDYSIPDELAGIAVPGVRVRVPLRSAGRVADGYLIEVLGAIGPAAPAAPAASNASAAAPEALPGLDAGTDFRGALSPIESVVSAAQVLTPAVWELARRVADRASGNASDIIRLAVPPRQVRVEKAWLAARAADAAAPADGTAATAATAAPAVGADPAVPPPPAFADYPAGTLDTAVAARARLSVAAVPDLQLLP
ncbi:MAG TPA: hypothetical protein VLO31_00870, partial [Cryobacterium sp.]|nr:hypothetical protein [Cryobacterium sp.]